MTLSDQPIKPWWQRRWAIAGGVIILLIIIGAISGSGDDEQAAADDPDPTATPVQTDEPTEAPIPETVECTVMGVSFDLNTLGEAATCDEALALHRPRVPSTSGQPGSVAVDLEIATICSVLQGDSVKTYLPDTELVIDALYPVACDGERSNLIPEPTPVPLTPAAALTEAIPGTPTIDGCDIAQADLLGRIETRLDPGLVLSVAYTRLDGPRQIIGASIYRVDDGFRVSSADTWILEDGKVFALSSSANEYSGFDDARDLPDRPSAGDDVPQALIDECLVPGLRS